MKEKIENIEMKEKLKIKTAIQKIVYKIKKILYDLMYRRLTYIPEKGLWISTVVFPTKLTEDGVCGVTDVFPGNEKKVNFELLHSVYIKKASDSGDIHRDVVKRIKGGFIMGMNREMNCEMNSEMNSGMNNRVNI